MHGAALGEHWTSYMLSGTAHKRRPIKCWQPVISPAAPTWVYFELSTLRHIRLQPQPKPVH